MKKGCCLLLLILLGGLISLVLLVGKPHMTVATTPVSYSALEEYDKKDVPPFAQNIYRACYAHWQVGEWAWRCDVPPDCEELLRQWLAEKGGTPRDVSMFCCPDDMPPPEWWNMPPDARLVSNRDLEFTRMSMWYSPTANRVWIFYEQ